MKLDKNIKHKGILFSTMHRMETLIKKQDQAPEQHRDDCVFTYSYYEM